MDTLVTLHQRKLTLLKQLKQAYLQKMFPEKKNKIPKLRFKNFNGNWKQGKFKDFSKKKGKKNSQNFNYPAYSVSNKFGLVSQKKQFDGSRLDDLEKISYKLVKPFEFAYNPARINVGSIAFNNLEKTVIVSSLYVVVKLDDTLDNDYILQFIKSPAFIKEVKRNTEGSVREYLFYENFSNIKFPYINSVEEQKKVGTFLKKMDIAIIHRQKKLDRLKELKNMFLKKMFI